MSDASATTQRVPEPALVQYTHWIYGLHALSVLTGVLTSTTVVFKFLFGLPSIVAVIMNYARRAEAHGTFLESHFRWQIRTFWFALLWVAATAVVSAPLVFVFVGLVTATLGWGLTGIWVVYRVARGWLALRAARPLLVEGSP